MNEAEIDEINGAECTRRLMEGWVDWGQPLSLICWIGLVGQAKPAKLEDNWLWPLAPPTNKPIPSFIYFLKTNWIKKEERVVFVGELAIQLITFHPVIKEKFTFLYGGGSSSFHQKQPFLPSTKKEKVLFWFHEELNGIKIYYNSNLRLLKYLNNAESAIV